MYYVGAQGHLSLTARRRREDFGLLGGGQLAVERQEVPAGSAGHLGEILQ